MCIVWAVFGAVSPMFALGELNCFHAMLLTRVHHLGGHRGCVSNMFPWAARLLPRIGVNICASIGRSSGLCFHFSLGRLICFPALLVTCVHHLGGRRGCVSNSCAWATQWFLRIVGNTRASFGWSSGCVFNPSPWLTQLLAGWRVHLFPLGGPIVSPHGWSQLRIHS